MAPGGEYNGRVAGCERRNETGWVYLKSMVVNPPSDRRPENPLNRYLDRKIYSGLRLRSFLAGMVLILALLYTAWEVYWYQKVGLAFIHGHTHILPYLLLFLLLALYRPERWKKVHGFLLAATFFLLFLETLLQLTGMVKTYAEKTTGMYVSPYRHTGSPEAYYHTWHTGEKEHSLQREEFTYTFPTNSLGFPDAEWELPSSSDSSIRIMTLGDSFTEGDGAPYDSSYVKQLEHLLVRDSVSAYIMNGGVCGSDPFFNFVNLRDRLLPYRPDMVLQTICSHDLYNDIALRGGMERFGPNYALEYSLRPWWEPVYAMSYTSRILFRLLGYNEELVRTGGHYDLQGASTARLRELLDLYLPLCRANDIELVLILRPDKGEITENRYGYDFAKMKSWLAGQPGVTVIDLLPLYREEMAQQNSEMQDYFWKQDAHHNARGYRLMANSIYRELKPLLSIKTGDK